jgi:hypothetical protein
VSKAWDSLREGGEGSTTESEGWEGSMDGGESFMDRQDGWGGFPGESKGPQRGEGGSVGDSEGWNSPQGRSEGWHGPRDGSAGPMGPTGPMGSTGSTGLQEGAVDESEGWDGLQREQEDSTGISKSSMGPQDQYCSSCNQKKPLITFGRFLTYNICRQRNTKANRVQKAKQKATIPPRPKATKEQLEYIVQAWGNISEYKLLKNFSTRPLTIEDYLNNKSSFS